MLKFITVFCLLMGTACAQNDVSREFMALEMCQSSEHRYDEATQECIYCAHGLQYDQSGQECEGKLNWLGKCYGEDHYHAATRECMYCAIEHEFNEETRRCELTN